MRSRNRTQRNRIRQHPPPAAARNRSSCPLRGGIGPRGLRFAAPPNNRIRRPLATSESTRARRFALPDLADERAGVSIQAFLDGPEVRRGRPITKLAAERSSDTGETANNADAATVAAAADPALMRTPGPARPSNDLRTLPGRLEWNAAVARESVRAARYGRPAAVAIVELKPDRPGAEVDPWLRTIAGPIARALRHDSRATDLVARVASTRFQMLLPETDEAGASRLAERVAASCRSLIQGVGAPVAVRICVAGTGLDNSLHEALEDALRAIEAA
ncbi:MAG: hypothetical protein ABIZ52_07860 [Candidatus Limnocylindrales bacterium]